MSVASWKKVIVSGSNAQLANLSVDQNINATGSVAVGTQGYQYIDATGAATTLSGSFSGSCLLYTSPSPRDRTRSRMPSSA